MPDEASQESEGSLTDVQDESREQLNRFLQARDISPVRHVLSVPWNEAQSRSKRRHVRKAEQCVSAVLDVLAPKASKYLWDELSERKGYLRTLNWRDKSERSIEAWPRVT